MDRRETERASAGRMVREAEGEHAGVGEGNIPGTRRRRARVEKRVRAAPLRPGHLAVLRRERSEGGVRAEMKRDRKRIVAAGRHEERGRSSRGEGVKACARDEGAQGEEGERNPWKSRGERFVAVTDPLAVARARQSRFSARESRRRARVSIGRSLHARHVEAINV